MAEQSRALEYHDTDQPYILSKDAIERNRLRRQHEAIKHMLGDKAFLTAPTIRPEVILDLGCGTGAVTNELAEEFPAADAVIGIDITPLEPEYSPKANVKFIKDDFHKVLKGDIAAEAGKEMEKVDFIFHRLLIYANNDWPAYVKEVYNRLRPNGLVEMQEFCDRFFYEDAPEFDTLTEQSWEWLPAYRQGAHQMGLDLDCGQNLGQWMRDAGFVDVQEKEYRMPYYYSAAPQDTQYQKVAELLIGDPDGMFYYAFPKLAGPGALGLTESEVNRLREQMVRCLGEERGKYQTYWVVTGRKPLKG